jgi:hypothetical protein
MNRPLKTPDRVRQLYPWGAAMARMQARACTISQLTGLSKNEACRIYKEVNGGRSSPSGQQPTSLDWFMKTPARRFHSAMFLMLYEQSAQHYPSGLALAHAFYHLSRMTADEHQAPVPMGAYRPSEDAYTLNFARASYLARVYDDEKDLHGMRKSSLKLHRCRVCRGIFLGEAHDTSRCPLCEKH